MCAWYPLSWCPLKREYYEQRYTVIMLMKENGIFPAHWNIIVRNWTFLLLGLCWCETVMGRTILLFPSFLKFVEQTHKKKLICNNYFIWNWVYRVLFGTWGGLIHPKRLCISWNPCNLKLACRNVVEDSTCVSLIWDRASWKICTFSTWTLFILINSLWNCCLTIVHFEVNQSAERWTN